MRFASLELPQGLPRTCTCQDTWPCFPSLAEDWLSRRHLASLVTRLKLYKPKAPRWGAWLKSWCQCATDLLSLHGVQALSTYYPPRVNHQDCPAGLLNRGCLQCQALEAFMALDRALPEPLIG